jgi:Phosphodiester glycosidase
VSSRVVIGLLALAVLAVPAAAARPQLAPGVTYERQVQLRRRGPVVLHVVTAPRPTGSFSLEAALSNEALNGRERLTAIQRRAGAPVVGVSGDFSFADGRPHGIVIDDGVLKSPPVADRSSLGINAAGTLQVARVTLSATWNGRGQRRPMTLNRPPGRNGVSLYTPAWGAATPATPGTIEAVIGSLPPTTPNSGLSGKVTQLRQGAGAIPAGGAVLVARGTGAQQLTAEAPVGADVGVQLPLDPAWTGVVDAIGGGPILVREGRAVFRSRESFSSPVLVRRQARAAVGQRADGRLLLVATDGGRLGYSVGFSNYELARALVRLGAVTGFALAPGPGVALASDGTLLTRAIRGGERTLADALLLRYRPAPPPG